MNDQSKVAIIVLNWNGLRDTLECIESVLNQDYDNFVIIVVDNGSTDDSPAIIHERYPFITILTNDKNTRFLIG